MAVSLESSFSVGVSPLGGDVHVNPIDAQLIIAPASAELHVKPLEEMQLVFVASDGTEIPLSMDRLSDEQKAKLESGIAALQVRGGANDIDFSVNLGKASMTRGGVVEYLSSQDEAIVQLRQVADAASGYSISWEQFNSDERTGSKAESFERKSERLVNLKWEESDTTTACKGDGEIKKRIAKAKLLLEKSRESIKKLAGSIQDIPGQELAVQGRKKKIAQVQERLDKLDDFSIYFDIAHPGKSLQERKLAAKAIIESRPKPRKMLVFSKVDEKEEEEYAKQLALNMHNGNRKEFLSACTSLEAQETREPLESFFMKMAATDDVESILNGSNFKRLFSGLEPSDQEELKNTLQSGQ